MRLVTDASVAVKWLVAEADSATANGLLGAGHELHAPRLLASEVGNALWRKARAGDLTPQMAAASVFSTRVGVRLDSAVSRLGLSNPAASPGSCCIPLSKVAALRFPTSKSTQRRPLASSITAVPIQTDRRHPFRRAPR